MKNISKIADEIEKELDEKDAVREVALKSVRAIIRLCSSAIRAMHRGEEARELLREAREEAKQLKTLLSEHPDLYYSGFVEAGHQEIAEAFILYAILKNTSVPSHRDLGIPCRPYILGMGDVVGELRRLVLDRIRINDIEGAQRYLDCMESIYEALMRLDYPSGLIAVRKKQDMVRTLLEKTRGEMALALRNKSLEDAMKSLEAKLKAASMVKNSHNHDEP